MIATVVDYIQVQIYVATYGVAADIHLGGTVVFADRIYRDDLLPNIESKVEIVWQYSIDLERSFDLRDLHDVDTLLKEVRCQQLADFNFLFIYC